MQTVSQRTREALDQAQTLIDQGCEVYLLTGSNPLHIEDIKTQYGKRLPGFLYLSYEQHKLERDLLSSLLTLIRIKHPQIASSDIALFYTQPKDPFPGIKGWCAHPLVKGLMAYGLYRAKKYVSALKQQAASSNGCTLIPCNPKTDQSVNIVSDIKKVGWIPNEKPNNALQSFATFTSLRHLHNEAAAVSLGTTFNSEGVRRSARFQKLH